MRETDKSPWAMQPSESSKAYEAFLAYRDMGTGRSQEQVGKRLGKSTELMSRWAVRFTWVERTRKWDEHQAEVKEKEEARQARIESDLRTKNAIAFEKKIQNTYAKLAELAGQTIIARIEAKQSGAQARKIEAKDSNGNPVEIRSVDESVEVMRFWMDDWVARARNPEGVEVVDGKIEMQEEERAAILAIAGRYAQRQRFLGGVVDISAGRSEDGSEGIRTVESA